MAVFNGILDAKIIGKILYLPPGFQVIDKAGYFADLRFDLLISAVPGEPGKVCGKNVLVIDPPEAVKEGGVYQEYQDYFHHCAKKLCWCMA